MDFSLSTLGCSLSLPPGINFVVSGSTNQQLKCQLRKEITSNNTSSNSSSNSRTEIDSNSNSNNSISNNTKNRKALLQHRDSWCLYGNNDGSRGAIKSCGTAKDDDDTASTLSITTASDSSDDNSDDEYFNNSNHDDSCCINDNNATTSTTTVIISTAMKEKHVHFASPMVTEVRTRPFTSRQDKYYLHYNEHDYIDFKIEFMTGRERTRQVSFALDVVTDIHENTSFTTTGGVLDASTKRDLFYTESELQGFLDDFVRSLNQRLSSSS